jgi:hypothetical protein
LRQRFVDRSSPCVFGQPKPVFAVNRTHQLRIRSLHDSGTDRVEVNTNASNTSSFKVNLIRSCDSFDVSHSFLQVHCMDSTNSIETSC